MKLRQGYSTKMPLSPEFYRETKFILTGANVKPCMWIKKKKKSVAQVEVWGRYDFDNFPSENVGIYLSTTCDNWCDQY